MEAYWKSNGHFPDGKETKRVYFKKDNIWHDAWFVGSELIHNPYWLLDVAKKHGYNSIYKFCQFIFKTKNQGEIFKL